MSFIYIMFIIYLPTLIIAIKKVAYLIIVASYLLKAADVFLKTLDGLINRFKSFKNKHMIRRHKKKLPHNSCRKHR